jgi:RHS repeat-associated protein
MSLSTNNRRGRVGFLLAVLLLAPTTALATTTDTFYPSMDGYVYNDSTSTSWPTVRDGTTGTEASYTTTSADAPYTWKSSNQYKNRRTFFIFDTSSIPDGSNIVSATFSLYKGGGTVDNANSTSLELIQTNPASDTALTTSDYDNVVAFTSGATKTLASVTLNAYNDLTVNATGRSWISTTGKTRLGLITGLDLSNTAPTGLNGIQNIGFSEISGTTQDPKLVVSYLPNNAPSAPAVLLTEGTTNPISVTDSTPEFSAIYNDADTSDVSDKYQIQVATVSSFASTYWDSATSTMATTSQGSRSPDLSYAGSGLASSTTYYWRIRFIDSWGNLGAWSTTTSTFILAPAAGPSVLQNISFTYDAMGNITQITDNSTSGQGKAVTYEYDDLHRLVTASTTAASSTPYRQTFTYSAIGNLTNKSDLGSYTYAETGYTNPHAPTTIGSTNYAYDNNGNVTSAGTWTYAWDFLNRLTSVGSSTATTTNLYDDVGERVKRTVGATSTVFANDWFNKTGATTTIAVSLPDGTQLATIEGNGAATSTYYTHTDHLRGTNVVTNASSTVIQTIDYYPYGTTRIDSGTDVSQREYIGEIYDEEAGLSYLNARMYEGTRGQFLSQDPSFLALGDAEKIKALTGQELPQYLSDPQQINSYSYARNNPLVNSDPTGNSTITSLLFNPLVSGLTLASFGAQTFGLPATGELLRHATSLYPSDLYMGNGSSVVNAIQSNPLYQSGINSIIQMQTEEGNSSFTTVLPLKFTSGDAYTSLGTIDLKVSGSLRDSGKWQISVSGKDLYNFDKFKSGAGVGTAAAGIGYVGEKTSAVTPFTTHIFFKQEIKSPEATKAEGSTKKLP